MKQAIMWTVLINCSGWLVLSQSPEPAPTFEIADVHVSAKTVNAFVRYGPVRGGRYEVKNATMVDLIRFAYGYEPNKILGGPNWLEMDRYDVVAKVPAGSTPETHKLMLQSLLEDRFKLTLHKETKPLPTYALTVGKKPLIKESDGKEEPGCRPQTASGGSTEGEVVLMTEGSNGVPTRINLGPGMTIRYLCRNINMSAFAAALRGMMGSSLGPNQVLDETGLKGNWNFDIKWSMQFIGAMGADASERISIFDAVEKQLGLKLEQRQIPTPVIVVDRVNEKPSDNPPGVAEALPSIPLPTEFEVASVKPSDPAGRGGRFQMQPGGRFNVEGMTLRFLIIRAFNTIGQGTIFMDGEQVAGIPSWADTERFDVVAKAPSAGPSAPAMDPEAAAPMLRALLADRFKMTYHTESRPVSAYTLVSVKPKMSKADPASRTSCKNAQAPPGAPPGSQVLIGQNITMAQFTERLQNMAPELSWPVLDATGIEGGWDFTLTFSRMAGRMMGRGRGGDALSADGAMPAVSDPSGALTVFEAVEKQLGLKLEMHKRPMDVIVVDHIEQKPTEN
jgi:uncharacterized protein (TIGR03435 family)